MSSYILDTNVWLAASGKSDAEAEIVASCYELLESIKQTGASIVLDLASFDNTPIPGNTVLQELKQNLNEDDYAFDLFWKHFYNNWLIEPIELNYDSKGAILPNGIVIYQEEDDGSINLFEPSDRKWIALHLEHPNTPVIHNATDSDWEKARNDLSNYGIKVKQIGGRDIP